LQPCGRGRSMGRDARQVRRALLRHYSNSEGLVKLMAAGLAV
jgi:hypothetical protein